MEATTVILDRLAQLLATDAVTLAPVTDGVVVHLIKEGFTPAPTTVLADLVECDFDGYTPLEAGAGAQQAFTDAGSGNRVVQLLEPVGGWHSETTGLTNLPQTVVGYCVTNNAGTVTYGSALLDQSVSLLGINDGIDIPNVRFTIPPDVIF